ncbi:MAG: hypothetical protein LBP35_02990 [Candidatus Ancillula trichonymphae]|nr:hypothetical protein [Candidatus Ancillula trichonymphae]
MKSKGFDLDFPPMSKLNGSDELDNNNPAYGAHNELLAAQGATCKQQTDFINYRHGALDDVEKQDGQDNLPLFEAEKTYNQKKPTTRRK